MKTKLLCIKSFKVPFLNIYFHKDEIYKPESYNKIANVWTFPKAHPDDIRGFDVAGHLIETCFTKTRKSNNLKTES